MNDTIASIVIPCFNSAKWLTETLASCLDQGCKNLEVIVIDDGSSDGSLDIVKNFGPQIRSRSIAHSGAPAARNEGLALAAGRYVKFLDADDLLEKGSLKKQIDLLERSGADVCCGDWQHVKAGPDGLFKAVEIKKPGLQNDYVLWLLNRDWCAPFAYLYRNDFLKAHQCRWNPELTGFQDFEFILKVALKGARFCYENSLTGSYRQHDSGPRVSKMSRMEMAENTEKIIVFAEQELINLGRLGKPERDSLCRNYLQLAKNVFGENRPLFRRYIEKVRQLAPDFRPPKKWYALAVRMLGYERVEGWLEVRRRFRNKFILKTNGWFF